MDINLPLILVIAVLITGVAWVLGKFKWSELKFVEFSGSLFPVLAVVLVLRSFLFEPFQIPSGSMIPTLKVGDFILVNKFSYGLRLPVSGTKVVDVDDPVRGDVMVFFPPDDDRYFIKRVVGLPGDKIEMRRGVLYVNGEAQQQSPHPEYEGRMSLDPGYTVQLEQLDDVEHVIRRKTTPSGLSYNYSKVVPEGHYFMMGDNRDSSSDSREWGSVPEENIVGKAVVVWMHWKEFFSLPKFSDVRKIQ